MAELLLMLTLPLAPALLHPVALLRAGCGLWREPHAEQIGERLLLPRWRRRIIGARLVLRLALPALAAAGTSFLRLRGRAGRRGRFALSPCRVEGGMSLSRLSDVCWGCRL